MYVGLYSTQLAQRQGSLIERVGRMQLEIQCVGLSNDHRMYVNSYEKIVSNLARPVSCHQAMRLKIKASHEKFENSIYLSCESLLLPSI